MPLAAEALTAEYDDRAARRDLAKAVDAYQAKLVELTAMRTAVKGAEAKLLAMQDEIDKSADAEDAVDEAAANALQRGRDISERNPAIQGKRKRDALIDERTLFARGFARLQGRAAGLEREADAELTELRRCREPIIQNLFERLAEELSRKESECATLRSRLFGFSVCSNGPVPQKLPPLALSLLRNPPANSKAPQINSSAHSAMNREKEIFRSWRRALESDAQAVLDL
jgi:hypothetical protein